MDWRVKIVPIPFGLFRSRPLVTRRAVFPQKVIRNVIHLGNVVQRGTISVEFGDVQTLHDEIGAWSVEETGTQRDVE